MESRALDLTIISAQGLKNPSRFSNLRSFAISWIDPSDLRTTTVDSSNGIRPSWNCTTSFSVPSISFYHPAARLAVQIFHRRHIGPRVLLGTVSVPLTDLANLPSSCETTLCYQIFEPSGQRHGQLKLAVRLGEISVIESTVADAPAMAYPAFADTLPPRKPNYQRYPNSFKRLPRGNPVVPYFAPPLSLMNARRPQSSGLGVGLVTGALSDFTLGDDIGNANNGGCNDGNFGGGNTSCNPAPMVM